VHRCPVQAVGYCKFRGYLRIIGGCRPLISPAHVAYHYVNTGALQSADAYNARTKCYSCIKISCNRVITVSRLIFHRENIFVTARTKGAEMKT